MCYKCLIRNSPLVDCSVRKKKCFWIFSSCLEDVSGETHGVMVFEFYRDKKIVLNSDGCLISGKLIWELWLLRQELHGCIAWYHLLFATNNILFIWLYLQYQGMQKKTNIGALNSSVWILPSSFPITSSLESAAFLTKTTKSPDDWNAWNRFE